MLTRLPPYVDDPILGLFEKYQADNRPEKVNLGIGVYCDAQGRVPMLQSARAARTGCIDASAPSVYLPTEGAQTYRDLVLELVFGEEGTGAASDFAVVQTVAGTGALKVGADFLKSVYPDATVWMPDPTWANHAPIFEGSGFRTDFYPYYDPISRHFDLDGAVATLARLPAGSIVLLHPCCHNPTGVDLTHAQWLILFEAIAQRGLLPFFDMAYQGFTHGVDEDAWPIRESVRRGIPCLVASSFSKIFALYGERADALSVFAPTGGTAEVLSHLKLAIRKTYSNPPAHGAAIVQAVLSNPLWRCQWRSEVDEMRKRMRETRSTLHDMLSRSLSNTDFGFLLEQNGMFSYSGLSAAQIADLQTRFGVYVVSSGRICIAGVNPSNLAHVIESLVEVMGGVRDAII